MTELELKGLLKEAYPFIELVQMHFGSNRAMRLAVEIENLGLDVYSGAYSDWVGCVNSNAKAEGPTKNT